MKIDVTEEVRVTAPAKVTLELSMEEAQAIIGALGSLSSSQGDFNTWEMFNDLVDTVGFSPYDIRVESHGRLVLRRR